MVKKQTGGAALAAAAQRYLEEHSRERFSLEQLAGALFVNGSYLMRVFRRHVGTTPLSYHHMLRCRAAEELLTGTDKSISEIGETVGFVSSSHFSHIFRKLEGCSPREYRLRHLREVGSPEAGASL